MGTEKKGDDGNAPPKAVISRLSLYLRELQHLLRDGCQTISSTRLGSLLGFSDAQVRKDLAYFGHFGYPGVGYRCEELIQAIRKILGTSRCWPVALVGVGNLGRALLGYRGFGTQGFEIVAAFDSDPGKVGLELEGIAIREMAALPEVRRQLGFRLAIIAVPAIAAQQVAEQAAAAGIEGLLNFSPVTLTLPKNVCRVGVDLAIELEQLSFAVMNRCQRSE